MIVKSKENPEFAITYMKAEDAPKVYDMMQVVKSRLQNKDSYCTDELSYIQTCITCQGFGVKAVCGGVMAGFLLLYFPSAEDEENMGRHLHLLPEELEKVAYMDSAAVLPEYRGRGLQREMMEFAEQSKRLKGYRYLMATVSPDNLYSMRNLQQLEYDIVCRCVKYGGKERYVMRKIKK